MQPSMAQTKSQISPQSYPRTLGSRMEARRLISRLIPFGTCRETRVQRNAEAFGSCTWKNPRILLGLVTQIWI
jgi:hypothetical protein